MIFLEGLWGIQVEFPKSWVELWKNHTYSLAVWSLHQLCARSHAAAGQGQGKAVLADVGGCQRLRSSQQRP